MQRKVLVMLGACVWLTSLSWIGTAAEVEQEQEQERLERLFVEALRLLPEENVPAEYRAQVAAVRPSRCATFLAAEVREKFDRFSPQQQAVLTDALARPDLPLSVVSPSGRFRIHYATTGGDAVPPEDADGNGVPDFVDETVRAFENTHDLQVGQHGYREPPDDNGVDGPEYDVYIRDLRGFYGLTTAEGPVPGTPRNDQRSYIEIDNDFLDDHFTPGVRGAQVTAAHEYLHAIQFGYRLWQTNQEPFYYELCSVWMEEVVYDDINDYYQYLPTFFRRTEISFNHFDRFLHYLGEALWNLFLQKKYQNVALFRRTWEIMESNVVAMDAINQALFEILGTTYADEFAEFAIWNYFTGSRADSVNFYDEAAAYPEIKLNGDVSIDSDTTIVDSSLSSTHRYYRFTVFEGDGYLVNGGSDQPQNWKLGLVVTLPGGTVNVSIVDMSQGQNLGFLPRFSEIVVIPINTQVIDGPNIGRLTSTYSRFSFSLLRVPADVGDEQGITAIYPNPFIVGRHGQLKVEFLPQNTERLEVRVLDAAGRVVKSDKLLGGSGAVTPTSFVWDGRDDAGKLVGSGIYLVQLSQDGFVQFKKFAVVRR